MLNAEIATNVQESYGDDADTFAWEYKCDECVGRENPELTSPQVWAMIKSSRGTTKRARVRCEDYRARVTGQQGRCRVRGMERQEH